MRPIDRLLLATTIFSVFGIASAFDSRNEQALQEIAPYKSWTRVNPKPIQVNIESVSG